MSENKDSWPRGRELFKIWLFVKVNARGTAWEKYFRGKKRAGRKICEEKEEKTRGRRGSTPKRAFTFAIYPRFFSANQQLGKSPPPKFQP